MGQEFGQFIEWNEAHQLDWLLLGYERHAQMQQYVRTLNRIYNETPALWQDDFSWNGFQWIVPDDSSQSIIVFLRRDESGGEVICVANFAPVLRPDYRFGVPNPGTYAEAAQFRCKGVRRHRRVQHPGESGEKAHARL